MRPKDAAPIWRFTTSFDMHDVSCLTILSQLRSAIEDHQLRVYN